MTTWLPHSPACSLAQTMHDFCMYSQSPCHWRGCLRCLGHMTVLVCGGSFLMRRCCLTHRLYSDHSPTFLVHLQPFFFCFLFSCHNMQWFLTHSLSLFQIAGIKRFVWATVLSCAPPPHHSWKYQDCSQQSSTASFLFPLFLQKQTDWRWEKYGGHLFCPVSGDKRNTVKLWIVYCAWLLVKRVTKGTEGVMGRRRGSWHSLKIA